MYYTNGIVFIYDLHTFSLCVCMCVCVQVHVGYVLVHVIMEDKGEPSVLFLESHLLHFLRQGLSLEDTLLII